MVPIMQNYKIVISYDGTDYCGWQRQPDRKTIQGLLENALFKLCSKKINVIGAGRTDAGVHAQGQVAHFKISLNLSDKELFRALNGQLSQDIRIISLKSVDTNFHARKMAKSKIYQYRIFNSPDISPFLFRYVLQWSSPLDVESMEEAAKHFIRDADFTPFSSNRFLHPVRKVFRSEIIKKGKEIIYMVEANGFLRYMVRTMVGTLLEIGRGRIPPDSICELFKQGKRSLESPTAPAHGLCLMKVKY